MASESATGREWPQGRLLINRDLQYPEPHDRLSNKLTKVVILRAQPLNSLVALMQVPST